MRRMENHCLTLLSYVSRHPEEDQSYESLGESCGIPVGTLSTIVRAHREHGIGPCYLCMAAYKYRYDFHVYSTGPRIIDAVRKRYF